MYTTEWTGASWRERKCPSIETAANTIQNQTPSIASPVVYCWTISPICVCVCSSNQQHAVWRIIPGMDNGATSIGETIAHAEENTMSLRYICTRVQREYNVLHDNSRRIHRSTHRSRAPFYTSFQSGHTVPHTCPQRTQSYFYTISQRWHTILHMGAIQVILICFTTNRHASNVDLRENKFNRKKRQFSLS